MHPGNIQVRSDGKYIALDFGIMGTYPMRIKNIWLVTLHVF